MHVFRYKAKHVSQTGTVARVTTMIMYLLPEEKPLLEVSVYWFRDRANVLSFHTGSGLHDTVSM